MASLTHLGLAAATTAMLAGVLASGGCDDAPQQSTRDAAAPDAPDASQADGDAASPDAGSDPLDSGALGDADGGDAEAGPAIEPGELPLGRIGEAYSAELALSPARGEVSWAVVGSLPSGLTLVQDGSATATVQGVPTVAGHYELGITATDGAGQVLATYSLRVRTLPWLVYATEEAAVAVDLSTGSPGAAYPFSRELVEDEVIALGDGAQPRGTQFAFQISDTRREGWVTNFSGFAPTQAVRINTPFSDHDRAQVFQWSQDGRRLSWEATPDFLGPHHSYLADASGPAPGPTHPLFDTLPEGGGSSNWGWGGAHLLVSVFGPTAGEGGTPASRLYTVDTTTLPPAAAVPCSPWGTEGGNIDSRGQRVSYWLRTSARTGELWVVGIGGAKPLEPQRLHEVLTGAQSAGSFTVWSADSSSVLFELYDRDAPSKNTSCRTQLDEDGPFETHCLPESDQWRGQLGLSPDEARGLFLQGSSQRSEDTTIWATVLSAESLGEPFQVNGPFLPGTTLEDPLSYQWRVVWSPDSRHVAYIADALQDDLREAFLVDVIDAPRSPQRLNTTMPSPTSRVTDLEFSPDGSWVALLADMETADKQEIFLVPIGPDGPGLPQKASDTLGANELFSNSFEWSSDGSFFGFSAYDNVAKKSRASIVRIHAGEVSEPMPISAGSEQVRDLHFLPAGF